MIRIGRAIGKIVRYEDRKKQFGFRIAWIPEMKCAGSDFGEPSEPCFVADGLAQELEGSADFGFAFVRRSELCEELAPILIFSYPSVK